MKPLIFFLTLCIFLATSAAMVMTGIKNRVSPRTVVETIPQTIIVFADKTNGPMKILTGILHGITYDKTKDYTKTVELISKLKPQFWRLSDFPNNVYGFVVDEAQFPRKQGTKIKFVVQDAFFNKYGNPTVVNPGCSQEKINCFPTFDDLKKAWEAFLHENMKQVISKNPVIDIYNIFAEPNWATRDQLFELFKIAHNVIRQYQPAAKIEALEMASYDEALFKAFLTYVADNKLRLDALSWNEFESPEPVVEHVNEMRRFIAATPGLCSPACPEIYIDEYLGPEHHLVPGWNVGWLYYLHEARVDQIHKACWPAGGRFSFKRWSTCWAGFNGMLLEDNTTPQNIYWVYKAYADMESGARLQSESSSSRVVALAGRNDSTKEIFILAGRYDDNFGPVTIQIRNYPYGNGRAKIEIFKIPDNGNAPVALASPVSLPVQYAAVEDGTVKIEFENFRDGEAYFIAVSLQPHLPFLPRGF